VTNECAALHACEIYGDLYLLAALIARTSRKIARTEGKPGTMDYLLPVNLLPSPYIPRISTFGNLKDRPRSITVSGPFSGE